MLKNNFSNNLRSLRINNNIKQSTIAQILNISQGAYAKYESGQREPSFDILLELSNIFNVSIDNLLNNSLIVKANNICDLPIDSKIPSDISTSINITEKLIKKKEYYLKEKARLETVLNKHIPNRLAEIDEILDILNKNNFQVNTIDNSDIDYEYYNDDFSTYQSKIAEDTPTYIPE